MFGGSRRHRPPPQPLTRETANPNAATAAASAFMRREPSLSSAAAAAALKARPTTPTNVAQVQSKRVLRRSASVSSTGSRERGRRELHRTPSNGSMSERTFRSPSPARSAVPNTHDVPPVPTLPKHEHQKSTTTTTNSSHKRATSLQVQPFRTGSQRLQDGHGSWFGAATAGDMSNLRHSDDVMNSPSDLRPVSPSSSINFSYPRSKLESPGSLAGSESTINDHTMVYDANSRRMVPRGELVMREHRIRDAPEKPVRKKKHSASKSGSHLAKGSLSRVKGTAVEPTPSETSQTSRISSQASISNKPRRMPEDLKPIPKSEPKISREQTLVEEPESDIEPPPVHTSKVTDVPVAPPLVSMPEKPAERTPEPVQEISESEDEEEDIPIPQNYRTTSPSTAPHTIDAVPAKPSSPIHAELEKDQPVAESETMQQLAPVEEPKVMENKQQKSVRQTRVHSESPHRTTHFAPTTGSLHVRHEPPPRSLSPRKSAMKQASPRDASPSENGSELSSTGMSQATQEDSATARKKSFRVSFDDQNTVVVGESTTPPETDSPVVASPQTKKPWHNIIGRYKRDPLSLEEDETMTPRPALPSFGSVREKKLREPEERPLVRPVDRTWSPQLTPQLTPTPPRNTSPGGTSATDIGQSGDLAIGSLLAQEQASRNEANISKYREPLPPVVTSVESSGYISNSSSGSDDEMETELSVPPEQTEESTRVESTPPNGSVVETKDFANTADKSTEENLPTISIIQPSPHPQDESLPESPQDFFDVPGGFPDDDTPEASDESKAPSVQGEDVDKSSAKLEQDRPVQESISNRPAPITPQRSLDSHITSPPSPQIHNIQEETEESEKSEESSIYSDAYEDLSDLEGDGFMSLDAVVDSPVNTKLSTKMFEMAIAKSKERDASKDTTPTRTEFREPLKTQDDWENAKAYWRSLSSDKRRQLEKEAMEEAGEEADLDEVPQEEKKKTKKRRSLEPKHTEPVPTQQPRDSTRVYQIQPGTTWGEDTTQSSLSKTQKVTSSGKLKKSMRTQEPIAKVESDSAQPVSMRRSMRSRGVPESSSNEGHLRKSLRAEPEPAAGSSIGMRKSLRGNGAADDRSGHRASLKKAGRPASYQPASPTQVVQSHRRNHSAEPGASPPIKPTLTRRGSDSSESSFKRARSDKGEGFGFKRTMRGSAREPAAPASDAGKASSRFSLRSLSPTGSAFRRSAGASPPPSMGMGGRMRQSLRPESSDGSTSRMRTSGFGRPAGKKPKKTKGGSRFADSSDEDDVRPAFRSRFAESSDEDDVPMPRPKQNGLPKSLRNTASSSAAASAMGTPAFHPEDEESSDLPDSDDEIVQPKRGTATNGAAVFKNGSTLKRSGSGRESLGAKQSQVGAQTETPRPTHTRRGSFMSILRRKKDPAGKISRDIKESAARKDTPLERSSEQLAVIRSNSNSNSARLQKRVPSWPLPEEHPDEHDEETSHDTYVDDEKRPSTAGGPASAAPLPKPGFIKRRSTSQGVIGLNHEEPVVAEGQKKKKFGTLRKMFGLHD